MNDDERNKRKKLFGKFSDGFQSLKPYTWNIRGKEIVEIPVTTLPIFKAPIHASYIIYLATISKSLAKAYWKTAVNMCRLSGTPISLLLHPLDFLSNEDEPNLDFFPGMKMPAAEKLAILSFMIDTLSAKYDLVDMHTHAQIVRVNGSKTRSAMSIAVMNDA